MRLLKVIIHIKVCLALGPIVRGQASQVASSDLPSQSAARERTTAIQAGAPPRWCVARGPHTTPKSLASEWEKEAGTAVKDPPLNKDILV